MLEKKCSKCGIVKPVEEFHKNRSNSIGIHHECKECANAFYNKYSKRKREEKMFEMKIVETKMCFKCKEVKPITEFAKCSKNSDGFYSYCRECQAEYAALYLQKDIPSTKDLETFIRNESILIAGEEKRMLGREKRVAARKIILEKKENRLLRIKEAAAKQIEAVELEPLFLKQESVIKSVEVVWESVGKLDPIDEVKKEIFNTFKKRSETNPDDYGVISNCRLSNSELKIIIDEFVNTGVLEERFCKEQNKYGYRYKTPKVDLKEDKGQLFN